jgi:hypothetical protein
MLRRVVPLALLAALLLAGAWLLSGGGTASSSSLASVDATGPLGVIDGDTFDVGGHRIRQDYLVSS